MKKERKLETRRKKANLLIQERDSLTSSGSNGLGGPIQVLLLAHQWRKLCSAGNGGGTESRWQVSGGSKVGDKDLTGQLF
jgi:hypothetical protein